MLPQSNDSKNNCSAPKRRLFLHIGSPKTGTTALQYYLYENRELLRQRGYLYPTGLNLTMAKAHHPLYFAVANTWWNPDFYYDITGTRLDEDSYQDSYTVQDCERELRFAAANSDNLIVSSEGFFDLDDSGVESLSKMLSAYDVTVLIYLRRQDQFIEAMYRHFINDSGARFSMPIEEYIDSEYVKHCNYLQKIETWARHFGNDKLVVTPYQQNSLKDGDVVFDFLDRVGLCTEDMPTPFRTNQSLPNDLLSTLSMANLTDWECRTDAADYAQFVRTTFDSNGQKFPLLSRTHAIEFLDRFSDDNKAVAQKFLGRGDGVLFEDAFPLPSDSQAPDQLAIEREKAIQILNKSVEQLVHTPGGDYAELVLASTALFKAARSSLRAETEYHVDTNRLLRKVNAALERSSHLHQDAVEEQTRLQEENAKLKFSEELANKETQLAKAEAENARSELERFKSEHTAAVAALEQSRTEVQVALQERDQALAEKDTARQEMEAETRKLEHARGQLQDTESDLRTAHQQAQLAESKADQALQDASSAADRAKQYEEQTSAARLEIKRLHEASRNETMLARAEIDLAQKDAAAANDQLDQLQRDVKSARYHADELAEQLYASKRELEKSTNEMQNLLWLAEMQSQRINQLCANPAGQPPVHDDASQTSTDGSTDNHQHNRAESGKAFWRSIAFGPRYAMRQPRKSVAATVIGSGRAFKYAMRHPRKAARFVVAKPWNALRYAVRQPKKAILLSFGVRNVEKRDHEHTDDNQKAAA